ncbi:MULTISPECIES: DapH/DapD/GlmU-related protein [unclassified Novosphingobium]|nr:MULTISPECIES: DapH/DapD/GlmU-related protein [unclassified Novosphingobium]
MVGKITIGRNVFIGARAFVLPGVSIADDAVIGACAVVSRSVRNADVVIGVPAKVVGRRKGAQSLSNERS